MAMRIFLILIPLLIASACSSFEYAPPPATPETITVAYPPTLGWMESRLHDCAGQIPEMVLLVEERVSPDLQGADVFLSPSPPPEGVPFVGTQLGRYALVMIANPAIDPTAINAMAIRNSYTSLEPPYQAWTYPANDPLHHLFETNLLEGSYTPGVLLAPDPEAMLEAVADSEVAIGFVPEASLDERTQVISLPEPFQARLELPIIAFTKDEPEGAARLFLKCLSFE